LHPAAPTRNQTFSARLIRRLARRLGLSGATEVAELRSQVQRLEEGQSGLGGGITELQDWNHGIAVEIATLKEWNHQLAQNISELADRLSRLEPRHETERALVQALSQLQRAHQAVGDAPRTATGEGDLTAWELRAWSQNGEDGVLAEILGRIGAPTRFFVEFGAETGSEGTCVYLADMARWEGVFIEADAGASQELERKYRATERITTLQAMVTPDNVQKLFDEARVPPEPDVLSIDVDGSDYWIWEALTDYRPRVLVIEYNAVLDPQCRVVQPRELGVWDGTDYCGASIGALRALGESKDYRFVHAELAGVNAFFVREDLADGRFSPPEDVPVRRPNFFMASYRHPRDQQARRYLDLDTGELVDAVTPETGE
jgi:hypothetical protein